MLSGKWFRHQRELRGLSIRDLETACSDVSQRYANPAMRISDSSISQLEAQGKLPTLPRVVALCVVLDLDIVELIRRWHMDIDEMIEEERQRMPATTSMISLIPNDRERRIRALPLKANSSGTQMLEGEAGTWVEVPIWHWLNRGSEKWVFARLGAADTGMVPLLLPGALLVIDPRQKRVRFSANRRTFENPIYFVRAVEESYACWCESRGRDEVVIYTHPEFPRVKQIARSDEVSIIGRVIGVYNVFQSDENV